MGQNFEKIGSKKEHNKKRGGTPQRTFILAEKVANMAPSWAPKSIKIDKKSMQKSIVFFDASWDRFLKNFGGFWKAKWSQVGTNIDEKSMPIAKCDFLKNRALAAAWARFL